MNDLYYIKYKAAVMLLDTMSMSPEVELAHRRYCDLMWSNEEFPADTDEFLMSFGRVPPTLVASARSGLVRKDWCPKDGHLVHYGALASLNEAKMDYVKQYNKTAGMRKVDHLKVQTDSGTGIVAIIYPSTDTPEATPNESSNVTGHAAFNVASGKSKSKSEPELPTGTTSQSSQFTPIARGTRLTFSMLSRMALEIKENTNGWHYDNHKLSLESLVPAGLVSKLRPFVDRVTDVQVREAWAEAAVKTHQAAVDGMEIKQTLAAYAIGIWINELNKLATRV